MNVEIEKIFNNRIDNLCCFEKIDEIVLYGAGQMGVDASCCLIDEGLNVKFFADKKNDIVGQKINNIEVKHPESFSDKEKAKYVFAIGIVTVSYNIIHDYLKNLGCKKICFVGDLVNKVCKSLYISRTWRLENPSDDEIKKINEVFEKYDNENSKKALIQYLAWAVNNEEKRNYASILKMDEKYFIPEVLRVLSDDETFVDYDFLSSTPVEEIEKRVGGFQKVHIFEPTVIKGNQVKEKYKSDKIIVNQFGLANENTEKYFTYGMGLSVKSRFVDFKTETLLPVKKLDDVMGNNPYSYLKIYGLGLSLDVVEGAIKTIKQFRPIIAVTIHHTRKDFIEIPNLLTNSLNNYHFHLRLHSYCGFETIFYAIPKEREG